MTRSAKTIHQHKTNTMPGSIRSVRTFDATSHRYDFDDDDEELPLRMGKPVVVNGLRSQVSLIQLPPSPADSELNEMRVPAEPTAEERRITRPIDRGAPGDAAIFANKKTPEQTELAKRKSQYYQDAFAYRESNTSARERVSKDSMIMADVRTNVIVCMAGGSFWETMTKQKSYLQIQDEYTFITDLSYALSTRYQRPESSIVVTVVHSACLLYAGSFDPAYTLTINALPSLLQPVTNKRNAALLAKSMEEGLGVPPERGLMRFVPVPEENFATGGMTLAGTIDEMDKQNAEDNGALKRSTSKSAKRQSLRSLRSTRKTLPTHEERITPTSPIPPVNDRIATPPPPVPAIPSTPSKADLRAEKAKKMGRRRSFMAAVFGK